MELEKLVGQEIQCRITKLDTAKEDVVVDRRVVLEEETAKAKEQRFGQLQENEVVRGTIRTVTDFGAFIDLGGFDGLLHVADMSWGRVAKPGDLVKAGDSIEVKVLKINRGTHKISLGLKQLQPDPWSTAAEKFKVGDRVKGTVSRITDFGAFVELDPGVDGLIHLSEMSWSKKVRKPADILKVGDLVESVVLAVNVGEHRIGFRTETGARRSVGRSAEEIRSGFGSRRRGHESAKIRSLRRFGRRHRGHDSHRGHQPRQASGPPQ